MNNKIKQLKDEHKILMIEFDKEVEVLKKKTEDVKNGKAGEKPNADTKS